MKFFIIICLTLIILFPLVNAYATPRDAELVLKDIRMEPFDSEKGDFVTINADVYNAGFTNTNSITSIVTAAYFIDGKLFHIDNIGDVAPGIKNQIKITSSPIPKMELESSEIKIVLDYHDTLSDQYDSPIDNVLKKSFFADSRFSTSLSLDISPTYVVQGNEMPKITVSLFDSDTNMPLNNKKIILNFNNNYLDLTTDRNGKISISNTFVSFGSTNVNASFEGDAEYLPSYVSSSVYLFPKEIDSSLIVTILDFQNKYNFENYLFDVLIFQDSYDNLIKKIQPDSTVLIDPKSFLVSLPSGHDYFTEIYLDGRLVFVTDKGLLKKNSILVNELQIPELATVRFEIVGDKNFQTSDMLIKNWIYSVPVEDGLTDWIEVLPTKQNNPYTAELFLDDRKIIQSEPFFLFSGAQETIFIATPVTFSDNLSDFKIPSWVKNNAKWWADGQIDDSSFLGGVQFLIQEGFITIPVIEQSSITQNDEIPSWVKNNAKWWADGQIDDSSFLGGVQFLIQEGLLNVR